MASLSTKQTQTELKKYLGLMSCLSLPEAWRQNELLQSLRTGQVSACQELAEGFLPLVVKWVAPYRGGPLTFQQLIERGNQAMAQAMAPYKGEAAGLESYLEKTVREEIEGSLKIIQEKQK